MKEVRILSKFLLAAALLFLLFCPDIAFSESMAFDSSVYGIEIGGIGKRESIRSVASELLEVGIEEYKRSLFGSAEESLLKAKEYKSYLSGQERSHLNRYLKSASEAAVRRKGVLEHIRAADKLVREGKIIRARAHLKEIKGSELLTEREKTFIKEALKKINQWLAEYQKQTEELYSRSVELYDTGQLENARAGFIKVARSGLLAKLEGETPEDYIHKIDLLVGKSDGAFSRVTDVELFERQSELQSGLTVKEGLLGGRAESRIKGFQRPEEAYMEAISRKRKLVEGYTRAVVTDSMTKAKDYLDIGKFYKAQQEIEYAQKTLEENRLYLGDDVFMQYNSQLLKLEQQITEGRKKWLGGFNGDRSLELQ